MLSTIWTLRGDPSQAVELAQGAMRSLGFTVEPDPDQWTGKAQVGNKVARVLVGGFARRHVVGYSLVRTSDEGFELALTPAMSGIGGGALGLSKAKKEQAALVSAIQEALLGAGMVVSVVEGIPGQR